MIDLKTSLDNIISKFKYTLDKEDIEKYILSTLTYYIISNAIKNTCNKDILFQSFLENIKNDVFNKYENLAKDLQNNILEIEKIDPLFYGIFNNVDFASNKLNNIVIIELFYFVDYLNRDVTLNDLGKAYEYLIGLYSKSNYSSGGEFYTPKEVATLLSRIILTNKNEISSIYDPTCGSGSLLLELQNKLDEKNIKIYGQEINQTTYNLCKVNLLANDNLLSNIDIKLGDTLTDPQHKDIKFDCIVSNPPYSISWQGDSNPTLINDVRFKDVGILAPKSKADMSFILHVLYHLKDNGIATIIVFPGILYRTGAEQKIRKYLVENNYIDCIIHLPSNLFMNSTTATSILVIKKNRAINQKILFIDASKEFVKEGKYNILTESNIQQILDRYICHTDTSISRYVDIKEIQEKDFNLSVSNYVQQHQKKITKDDIDLLINDSYKSSLKRNMQYYEIDNLVNQLDGKKEFEILNIDIINNSNDLSIIKAIQYLSLELEKRNLT